VWNNTVFLSPEPLGKKKYTRTGLGEFTSSLLNDTFKSLIAVANEQTASLSELSAYSTMTAQTYAEDELQLEDVEDFISSNPGLGLNFEEARLALAKKQLSVLKKMASQAVPTIQIESGKIQSSLLFSFSETENSQNKDGTIVPKAIVRPPSAKTAELKHGSHIAGSIELNFKVIHKKQ